VDSGRVWACAGRVTGALLTDVPALPDRGDGFLSAADVETLRTFHAAGLIEQGHRAHLAHLMRVWSPPRPAAMSKRPLAGMPNDQPRAILNTDPRAGWELVERLKRM
jgi:hypothetical protein